MSSAPAGRGLWIVAAAACLLVMKSAVFSEQSRGAPRDVAAQSGNATISGTVLSSTGAPLSGATVTVSMPGLLRPQNVNTDEAGRYEITNLPAGRYTLTAARPGYIRLAYGQTRPTQSGRQVVVADKQVVRNINFALSRGGVIAGTVVDEQGQPVIGAVLSAVQRTFKDGKPSATFVVTSAARITGLVVTNDLGEFRVYGLEPGVFYVGAMVVDESASPPRSSPIFYAPGTPNLSDAQRLSVGLGQTVAGVSIVLGSARTVTVEGVAVGRDQQPLSSAPVTLSPRSVELTAVGDPRVVTGSDGRFTFTGVFPGDYHVVAQRMRDDAVDASIGRVLVGGQNVTDLRLSPVATATASGRILVDPAGSRPPPEAVKVMFEPLDQTMPESQLVQIADVEPDFRFTTPAVASYSRVAVHLPAGWVMRRVRWQGQDITDSGVELRPGELASGLEIEVTSRLTGFSGTVRASSGEMIEDCTVLVFARNPEQRDGSARRFAVLRPDQNGTFSTTGLAAGEYLAAALEYVDINYAQDPQLLESVAKVATPFSLADGEAKTLPLTLSVAP